MACSCASSPCTCGGPQKFTRLDGRSFGNTLAARLTCTVDALRDLRVQFGLRPYMVRLIRTRWTGGRRGVGEEYVTGSFDILPTPLIQDLTALTEILQPVGLDEVGGIQLSEVSGRYTEEQLRGIDTDGTEAGEDEQRFYEIEFPRLDGQPGERRRFFIRSAPQYYPDRFQWIVRLERSHESRARDGALR